MFYTRIIRIIRKKKSKCEKHGSIFSYRLSHFGALIYAVLFFRALHCSDGACTFVLQTCKLTASEVDDEVI
jgi:hypothetical protein